MGKRKDTLNCAVCGCEIESDKPHVIESHYACTEEVAARYGIPRTGLNFVAVCIKCREEDQGSKLQ